MLQLVLHTFTSVCVLAACVSAVTTETVVGVAGSRVVLPCRVEAVLQGGAEVCWGRGEPSLFGCHNAVIHRAGGQVTYRKSYRFSLSSSSSLSIVNARPSDSGFFHCRVLLPGLFNDQTATLHLIITSPHAHSTKPSQLPDSRENLITVPTTKKHSFATGSGVTADSSTGPVVAQVQLSIRQQDDGLQIFIGNTVRASFIIFIPALLLTAAYRVWRMSQTGDLDGRLNQFGEKDSSV